MNDLSEFDKTLIEYIPHNLHCPAQVNPLVIRSKSQKRFIIVCEVIQYYETIVRVTSALNIQWIPVVKNFEIHWTALKATIDKDVPDTPKIRCGLNVMK